MQRKIKQSFALSCCTHGDFPRRFLFVNGAALLFQPKEPAPGQGSQENVLKSFHRLVFVLLRVVHASIGHRASPIVLLKAPGKIIDIMVSKPVAHIVNFKTGISEQIFRTRHFHLRHIIIEMHSGFNGKGTAQISGVHIEFLCQNLQFQVRFRVRKDIGTNFADGVIL